MHLRESFAYLAVVLDAFSRKVIGWAFDDHLKAKLAIAALDCTINARQPKPHSVIHHSDPRLREDGVQYASNEYRQRLDARAITPSMSRPANPYDNAKADGFAHGRKGGKATSVCGPSILASVSNGMGGQSFHRIGSFPPKHASAR